MMINASKLTNVIQTFKTHSFHEHDGCRIYHNDASYTDQLNSDTVCNKHKTTFSATSVNP